MQTATSLSVVGALVVPLGSHQRKVIERLDREDLTTVITKTRKDLFEVGIFPDEDFFVRGEFALRQYHAVAFLDPRNEHAISDTLDPFWHAQILFTRKYVAFCNETMGHYIHHEPLDHGDPRAVAHIRALYDHTHARLVDLFGQIDQEFFPKDLPDTRLVCRHCQGFCPKLLAETRYPQVFACTH